MQAVSGVWKSAVLAFLMAHSATYAIKVDPSCISNVGKSEMVDTLAVGNVRNAQLDLSLALLKQLAPALLKTNGNLVLSPHSIATAMSLLRAGTRGKSAEELDEVLGFTANHLTWEGMLRGNRDLAQQVRAASGGGSEFKVSNALWMDAQFSCNPLYRQRLGNFFRAPVEVVKFGTEAALTQINNQVSQDTGKMIHPFLDQTSANDSAILTNAVYLDAIWEIPFDENLTTPSKFHHLDGSNSPIQMMNRKDQFRSVQRPKYTSVRLPLAGGKLHVDLVLPKGNLDTFVEELQFVDLININRELEGINQDTFTLGLPQLDLDFSANLIPAFKNLGLHAPFQKKSGPDFSGMLDGAGGTSVDDLFVSLIQHTSKLRLTEKGVKASSGTAVGMSRSVSRMVNFDRPFLLLIGDDQSTPLFVTAVSKPQ